MLPRGDHAHRAKYLRASRRERGEMLTHLETTTGLHRKSLSRLLRGSCQRRPRGKQRGRTYGAEVDDALRVIADSHDYICAERLHGNLVQMAEQLIAHGELHLTPALREKLDQISVSTIRRTLDRILQDTPRLKRRVRPGPPNALRQAVPVRRIPWDVPLPGYLEVDLVHHSGRRTTGEYVHTLVLVDVATGWCEMAAILGRSYLVTRDGFLRCLDRLPFAVREIHTDNGAEFFNHHMEQFWHETLPEAERSRNRPYFKNDAPFVEHRNGDLVRGYIGHDRLDTAAQTRALNAIYERLLLYHNLFQPVLRLESKTTSADGQRTRRRYSAAQTPFQRVCAAGVLSCEQQADLEVLRLAINPRQLRRELRGMIADLLNMPSATLGKSEDVHETLYQPLLLGEEEGSLR